jgi:hypothetical protein
LLTGEFTSPLRGPMLSIGLLNMDSHSLLLLIGLLLLRKEPSVRLRYSDPQRDHRDGQRH